MNEQGGRNDYYHSQSKRDSARVLCWLALAAVAWLVALGLAVLFGGVS